MSSASDLRSAAGIGAAPRYTMEPGSAAGFDRPVSQFGSRLLPRRRRASAHSASRSGTISSSFASSTQLAIDQLMDRAVRLEHRESRGRRDLAQLDRDAQARLALGSAVAQQRAHHRAAAGRRRRAPRGGARPRSAARPARGSCGSRSRAGRRSCASSVSRSSAIRRVWLTATARAVRGSPSTTPSSPKKSPGPEPRHHALARRVLAHQLDLARADHVELVGRVALVEDHLARRERALVAACAPRAAVSSPASMAGPLAPERAAPRDPPGFRRPASGL